MAYHYGGRTEKWWTRGKLGESWLIGSENYLIPVKRKRTHTMGEEKKKARARAHNLTKAEENGWLEP